MATRLIIARMLTPIATMTMFGFLPEVWSQELSPRQGGIPPGLSQASGQCCRAIDKIRSQELSLIRIRHKELSADGGKMV